MDRSKRLSFGLVILGVSALPTGGMMLIRGQDGAIDSVETLLQSCDLMRSQFHIGSVESDK
jgi:hypothetical protein